MFLRSPPCPCQIRYICTKERLLYVFLCKISDYAAWNLPPLQMWVSLIVILKDWIGDTFSVQLILLEDAWRELFVLGIAQWAIPVDSTTLLAVSGTQPASLTIRDPRRRGHVLHGDICSAPLRRHEHWKHRVSADDENHVRDSSPSGGGHPIQTDAPGCDGIRLSEMHCDLQSWSVAQRKHPRQHNVVSRGTRLNFHPFPSSYTR